VRAARGYRTARHRRLIAAGLNRRPTGDDQPPRLGNKLVPSRTFVREQLANFSDCLHERIVRLVWVTAGQMPVALRQRVREIVVYPYS